MLAQLASSSGVTDTVDCEEFYEAEEAAGEMANRLDEPVHLYTYQNGEPVHYLYQVEDFAVKGDRKLIDIKKIS